MRPVFQAADLAFIGIAHRVLVGDFFDHDDDWEGGMIVFPKDGQFVDTDMLLVLGIQPIKAECIFSRTLVEKVVERPGVGEPEPGGVDPADRQDADQVQGEFRWG